MAGAWRCERARLHSAPRAVVCVRSSWWRARAANLSMPPASKMAAWHSTEAARLAIVPTAIRHMCSTSLSSRRIMAQTPPAATIASRCETSIESLARSLAATCSAGVVAEMTATKEAARAGPAPPPASDAATSRSA
eukprot:750741-Prymnesium_polylepis.1